MYHTKSELTPKACDSCVLPECMPHSVKCLDPLKKIDMRRSRRPPTLRKRITELLRDFGPLTAEAIAYDLDTTPSKIETSLDGAVRAGDILYRNGGYILA